MRPSPRVEGRSKASVQLNPSSARQGKNPTRETTVIPDKLALRASAARKAMKGKTGQIYKKNNANVVTCGVTDPDTEE